MPQIINISDDDIQNVERILLPNGKSFDNQRRTFIKNLDTLDLQAVPGSGKTTALLAKLLILEKYLPFHDNSGVLVISHTNVAVDEIKERIRKHCPNLFLYPNFIGTIQSFVDEFLTIPYYSKLFKKKLHRIDDELYKDYVAAFSDAFLQAFTSQEQNNAKRYLRVNDTFRTCRFSHINNQVRITNKLNGPELTCVKPRGKTKPRNYTDWSVAEKTKVKHWIKSFKLRIMKQGILCYDDAYFLAEEYILKLPSIIKIIQNRFKYVFVDEMQDMDKHQYELLEKIFWNNGDSMSKYQRIGDKNQSIFNGDAKLDNIWSDRDTILQINGSHRLNPKIAKVVECFALSPIRVDGLLKNDDGSDIPIKPCLLLYENDTISKVLPKYCEVIKNFSLAGELPLIGSKFKAIAWTTKSEGNKIKLDSYFKDFSKEIHKITTNYDCIEAYLGILNDDKTLGKVRENILNALLKTLRLEKVRDDNNRNYTKRKMLNFIMYNSPTEYENLKLNLYKWSLNIVKDKKNLVLEELRAYIPRFLQNFGDVKGEKSSEFVNRVYEERDATIAPLKLNNLFSHEGINVEVTTVHSVKGQTNTGILYMESFYDQFGGGNYESERLKSQFKGVAINDDAHEKCKQSAKMVYVGFSRPTHLLCFAVHKDRYDKHLSDIDREIWDVIAV